MLRYIFRLAARYVIIEWVEPAVALTADGALHTWGHGEGGKLGHGDVEEEQATPCLVGAMEGCLI